MWVNYNIIVDCYMNTIGDMQNEMDFFYHWKKFQYNHDCVIFFWKIGNAFLVYAVLDNNVFLYEKD